MLAAHYSTSETSIKHSTQTLGILLLFLPVQILTLPFLSHIKHTIVMPATTKITLALIFLAVVSAAPTPQLAGEGAAADSIFTSTDNGIGYGIENAENNLAGLVTSLKGSAPAAPARRQLDKVSNGFQTLSIAAGTGGSTTSLTGALDTIDGDSTSGAANLGADIGALEESTLEAAGNSVPRV